jgi:hypothetical protein
MHTLARIELPFGESPPAAAVLAGLSELAFERYGF